MHERKNLKMGAGSTRKNKKMQQSQVKSQQNAAKVDMYMTMYEELLHLQLEMLEIKEQYLRHLLEMSQPPSKEVLQEVQQERQHLQDRLDEVHFSVEEIRDELEL